MWTPLKKITTFQDVGSVLVTKINSVNALSEFIQNNPSYVLIGKGSNVLINPKTTKAIVQLTDTILPTCIENSHLCVSAGLSGTQFLKECIHYQLSGLEFIAGVPTSVGGMIAMNFGAFGSEISTYVGKAYVMDEWGETHWLKTSDLDFNYRHSLFLSQKLILLEVCFKLLSSQSLKIENKIQEYIQIRKEKQPLGQKTFGSIFKNPPNDSAGRLLEVCGYRGQIFKNMKIFEKHANFLINIGGALFEDTVSFIKTIQSDVLTKTGILLEPEVRIID